MSGATHVGPVPFRLVSLGFAPQEYIRVYSQKLVGYIYGGKFTFLSTKTEKTQEMRMRQQRAGEFLKGCCPPLFFFGQWFPSKKRRGENMNNPLQNEKKNISQFLLEAFDNLDIRWDWGCSWKLKLLPFWFLLLLLLLDAIFFDRSRQMA